MTTVIRLETVVDVGAGRGADDTVDGAYADEVSVSATLSAVLDGGERITLLDDRGWATSARWGDTTMAEIEDTARTVVGPDEPREGQTHEAAAADHWGHLADILARQGVVTSPDTLRSIPHDVVVSEAVRTRLAEA